MLIPPGVILSVMLVMLLKTTTAQREGID